MGYSFALAGEPKGCRERAESPPASGITRQLCRKQFPVKRPDAPTTAREWNLPFHGALTLFFRWRKKSVQKKASGTATPKAAHIAMHCGQALRYACAWLRASWLSAISGASRPSASLGRGLRPAVAPSGLSSSTGCPVSHSSLPVALLASHPPCGSLWAAPKAPLGPRFPSGQFAALTRQEKGFDCPF